MIFEFFRYFDIFFLILLGLLVPIYVCQRWCNDDNAC